MEKAPDADFLREMIGFAAERSMELDVGALTGAPYSVKKQEQVSFSATAIATGIVTRKRCLILVDRVVKEFGGDI